MKCAYFWDFLPVMNALRGGFAVQEPGYALGDLLCCLVGKGHGKYLVRFGSTCFYKVSDSVAEDPGFTCAGSCNNKKRADPVCYGLILSWI